MTYFKIFANAGKTDKYQWITQCWQTYVLANKDALKRILHNFEFLPRCYRDTPILGDFEFFTNIKDKQRFRQLSSFSSFYWIDNNVSSINLRKARVSGLKRCCLFNKSWKKKKVVWILLASENVCQKIYNNKPILRNFEFLPTLRYSDKPILRNFECLQKYVIPV